MLAVDFHSRDDKDQLSHTHFLHSNGNHNGYLQFEAKAVVPCQNKIILKNFRPEPPPSVDRLKIIISAWNHVKIILKNFGVLF